MNHVENVQQRMNFVQWGCLGRYMQFCKKNATRTPKWTKKFLRHILISQRKVCIILKIFID